MLACEARSVSGRAMDMSYPEDGIYFRHSDSFAVKGFSKEASL